MDSVTLFDEMFRMRACGKAAGIYSVCSANTYVLQAAMEQNALDSTPLLIEATANQVNQYGGYTGMTPEDFSRFVFEIAKSCGFPRERIVLGGDHLGPLTWKSQNEAEAMSLAEALVSAYVDAGFTKIHLDTSMKLASDDRNTPLDDTVIAARGARLCLAAEEAYNKRLAREPESAAPVYVIGSEVPTPGGPQDETDAPLPTDPQAFIESYKAFKQAFADVGLEDAFSRVAAFVVQPGVEFTGNSVFDYDRNAAAKLCAALRDVPKPIVFEGHSTDYQTTDSLCKLVKDGIAVLKVGPALTFALREGLIALENIERELFQDTDIALSNFSRVLEAAMLRDDSNWRNHYKDSGKSLRLQMMYSFFDRSRYYLHTSEVDSAISLLIDNLKKIKIPLTLLSQYLPKCYERVRENKLNPVPQELLKDCVKQYLTGYSAAIQTET